jgi:hypothetical protein
MHLSLGTNERYREMNTRVGLASFKEGDGLEDPGPDGKIIMNGTLR